MKNSAVVVIILSILFSAASVYAQTTIKAEVDKTSITTDEVITYKLTIISTDKNVSGSELPKFEGFSIISQVQSSKVSLTNNEIKNTIAFTYTLAPNEIGIFKIEPARIKIKGGILSSEAFEIEVKEGRVKPQPEEEPPLPEEAQPESEQPLKIIL